MPGAITADRRMAKVVLNHNLDKYMDYRADELTQSAQAVYDDVLIPV